MFVSSEKSFITGSFKVSLFADFGGTGELRTGWWGAFGTFVISKPMVVK